ncbi:MAG: hypothetical protein EPN91_04745 [Salinibacterium sp.]|nr:MAG: hypothetical protein EPN91_04745 [Salinibacterium sp.]
MTTLYLTGVESTTPPPPGIAASFVLDPVPQSTPGLNMGHQVSGGTPSPWPYAAISRPLAAATISGPITWQLLTWEETDGNGAASIRVLRLDGAGAVLATVLEYTVNQSGGELAIPGQPGSNYRTGGATPTATTIVDGDRLAVEVWVDHASHQGGTGKLKHTDFAVHLDVAAEASWVAFTEDLVELP